MADPVLRFAIGSSDAPISTVWRLWVHKRDVYLAARSIAGLYKFSMHESGQWISAATSQSGADLSGKGSRRHKVWERPPEFYPGWTQGPAVMAPWVEWSGEIPIKEAHPKGTIWIPGPGVRQVTLVSVLISAPGVDPNEISNVSQAGDIILGKLPVGTGEHVWLQGRTKDMSSDELTGLAEVEKEFRAFNGAKQEGHQPTGWGMWVAESPDRNVPLLIQFALGHRHLTMSEHDHIASLIARARERGELPKR